MSRMDRYYEKHPEDLKRTHKNSKLYDEVYNNADYDNVESVNLSAGKRVNINDIKELLERRDLYSNDRDYRIVKPEKEVENKIQYYEIEEPESYDLNEMIGKAKEERPVEEKRRSLADTQVLTLKELVNSKSYAEKESLDSKDVKDLLDTIYDTNLIKTEDGDGLLDGLKSTGKTIVSQSIKQVLDDAKKEEEKPEMDTSFFTSSLGFTNDDLQNVNDTLNDLKESNEKTTQFLIILAILFIMVVIFIIIKFVL